MYTCRKVLSTEILIFLLWIIVGKWIRTASKTEREEGNNKKKLSCDKELTLQILGLKLYYL